MKKVNYLFGLLTFLSLSLNAQNSSITLTFNADNNGEAITMDSLKIQNITQGGEIVLFDPVSTYEIIYTGINHNPLENEDLFILSQNHPNPFGNRTNIEIHLKEKGILDITIYNILGKKVAGFNQDLESAIHGFSFIPEGKGCYFLTIHVFGHTQTIKMISQYSGKSDLKLEYLGMKSSFSNFKNQESGKDLPFDIGDQLLYVGYSELGESGMSDTPESDTEYSLQFATNIPCIGEATVDYGGQVYNTIQVYNQCWFKENLNAGTMDYSGSYPSNNDTIEKYCFADDPYACTVFGGLYFWAELMAYDYVSGTQGICPEGWHIPSELDWQILEGAVDSEFGIGDPVWGNNNWRGSDAGGNLKQTGTSWWEPPNSGATDAYGFTALPAGYFVQGDFWGAGYKGFFYSSNISDHEYRNLDWDQVMIKRGAGSGNPAFSVRCVKDSD